MKGNHFFKKNIFKGKKKKKSFLFNLIFKIFIEEKNYFWRTRDKKPNESVILVLRFLISKNAM